jgi:hypothetical protein
MGQYPVLFKNRTVTHMVAALPPVYTVMINKSVCFWQRLCVSRVKPPLAAKGLADTIQVNFYITKVT